MYEFYLFSVLFNGDKIDEFKPTRGIRQGDPTSPYLFLLAAEGLSAQLKLRGNNSDLIGVTVAPTAPRVSHLPFADDSLLFMKASKDATQEMMAVLDLYRRASSQRVNLEKSSVFFGKGVPNEARIGVKTDLNVHSEAQSERYLGMPMEVGKSKNGVFKYTNDRI